MNKVTTSFAKAKVSNSDSNIGYGSESKSELKRERAPKITSLVELVLKAD